MSQAESARNDTSAHEVHTIVLLGKNRRDKVQIVNTILDVNVVFPETSTCSDVVLKNDYGIFYFIITADLYQGCKVDEVSKVPENLKSLYSGPRVFLLVIQEGQVSSEEIKMFEQLKKFYCGNIGENTVVVVIQKEENVSKKAETQDALNYKLIVSECHKRVLFKPGMESSELIQQLLFSYKPLKMERIYEDIDEPVQTKKAEEEKRHQTDGRSSVPPQIPKKHHKNILTLVLLGQTGSGKSATGNTLLGRPAFHSIASSTITTRKCQETAVQVSGIKLRVIDTPDFFNEDLQDAEKHIQECKDLSNCDNVVYLLVMHMGRFTDGEREFPQKIKEAFGEEVMTNTVILFTGKEKLKDQTLDNYVTQADPHLQELINKFGGKYYAVSNEHENKRHKDMIDDILKMKYNEPQLRTQFPGYKQECKIL